MPVTSVPRRIVLVDAARKPSVAVLSSMSSHSRPTLGICTTWSITESDENPASSARPGDGAEAGRRLRRGAGPREPADLQSEAHRHGLLLLAPSGGRCVVERPGHDLDRAVGDAVDGVEPRRRASSTVAASERSWLVTTADGTASGRPGCGPGSRRSGVSTTTAWHGTPAARGERPVPRPHVGVEGGRVDDRQQPAGAGAWPRSGRGPRGRRASPAGRGGGGRRRPAGRRTTPPRPAANHEAAHVDLPDPAAPTSTTRHGSGSRIGHRAHTRAPPVHDRTMIFTTRCAGCDRPGATLCRTCRFALVSPRRPGDARACSSPRRSPAGSATSCSGSSTATGGRSPATSPGCSSTGSPASGQRVDVVTWAPTSAGAAASGGSTRPSSSPGRSPASSACRAGACSSAAAARRRRRGRPAPAGSAGRRSGPTRACPPARVLVVDDVVTTGATLHAAAAALRGRGRDRRRAWPPSRRRPAQRRPARSRSPERGTAPGAVQRWSRPGATASPCGDGSRTARLPTAD